ncbi:hypothetical protein [Candidatus Poriferisodalis sp.]|uniref:hypothetical protein n=1 Tax=Candidatus Poriferisodalis sp. TaxID=3101277 RepID=UPI003B0186C7
MDLGAVLIAAAAVAALIMAGGIVDILRLGRDRFQLAGKRRWHWVLLIIYSGPLGVLLYAAAVRPQVSHPERYADEGIDVPAGDPVADRADNAASSHGSAAVGGHTR